MRYLAMTLTLAVVVLAIWTVRYANRASSPGSSVTSAAAMQTQVAMPTVILPPDSPRHFPLPTPEPELRVPTSEKAIRIASGVARSFEETEPVLIDATLLPYRVAAGKLGDSADDGPPAAVLGWTPEDRVWLVRMRGSFLPSMGRHLLPENPTPVRGWMFVLIDPETGWPLRQGYFPEKVPVR